ncbi:biotin/lipoyl-containing protein [Roseiarcus sp.]|uniref:biotin/lipoyl-containing protein n=1 Tax=Roseiarcus sp. TaxID=1969460 RepID=UPI003F9B2888
MQRKFRISVDGHAYEVVVEEIAGEGGATSWPGSVAAASAAVAAAAAPATAEAKPAAKAGDEVAPLAGTVQSVDVTVGQAVKAGDKIATIEAMKMKTEVHAKGAGKVVSIAVKPGDSVDTGGVLLTLA